MFYMGANFCVTRCGSTSHGLEGGGGRGAVTGVAVAGFANVAVTHGGIKTAGSGCGFERTGRRTGETGQIRFAQVLGGRVVAIVTDSGIALAGINVAEGSGCQRPVGLSRMRGRDAVAGVAGPVSAAAAEIGTVTMLAVGQAVYTTSGRFIAGKLTMIGRSAPWRRIDGRVCMAGDAMAHGGVEAAGIPLDIERLGRTGRVGAVGVANGADSGIGGISGRMTSAAGGRSPSPWLGWVRSIVIQQGDVTPYDIHTGSQGASSLEERRLGTAVAVAVAAIRKTGGAYRSTPLGLGSVVDWDFPGLGRNRELGCIGMAGHSMAHGVVKTSRCAGDRNRCRQALVINVASGAGDSILGIRIGMNTAGSVGNCPTPRFRRVRSCSMAGEATDR